jgi:circadian clock protein KaiC
MANRLQHKALKGVQGMDDIVAFGLSQHVFLLEGNLGTGKTTIALQLLIEGANLGE